MDHSLLSLGDMLTFVGLIIAAFQLIKPRYLLIWKLTNSFIKAVAIALLIIGYLSPLTSILTPDTKALWNGLNLDSLLQVAGFVSITLGLLIIVFIYSHFNYLNLLTVVPKFQFQSQKYPKKKWRHFYFNAERSDIVTLRSAKKFYSVTSLFLVRGHIEEVVEITRMNLKPLVHSARQYNPRRSRLSDEKKCERPETNGANYAFETLYQLLTDQTAMKHITTHNRFFLHAIVECDIDDDDGSLHNEFAGILYTNIIKHLVLNTKSSLYTQKEANNGTARFANVYDLLTDDKIIRRQHILPSMLTWNVSKADVPLDEYADVLLELLERMIGSYKKQPDSTELLSNIRSILDQLIGDNGVTRRLAYDKKSRKQYAEDAIGSMGYKVVSKINPGSFFSSDDPDGFKKNDAEIKSENKRATYDQTTLTGLLAHKAFELIEDLTILYSDADDSDYNVRMAMFECVNIHVSTPVANRYKQLLLDRLFDKAIDGKIEQYATNIKGYYPNVLRALIDYLVPFTPRFDEIDASAQNRLRGIMANELKEALLNDTKMANDQPMKDVLLPLSMEVVVNKSKKTVEYYYINQKGKRQIINLDAPIVMVTAAAEGEEKET